jgi:hypothetical protein
VNAREREREREEREGERGRDRRGRTENYLRFISLTETPFSQNCQKLRKS